MPILWKYLLKAYFQVFSLCLIGFISILLVAHCEEIAKYISAGASTVNVLTFVLCMIPSILVYAIPVSCLIGSILLFQRLSHTHELTSIRASGMGVHTIALPLILTGSLMMLLNFTIASEIAPLCRAKSKVMGYEMTAINPLVLLQKDTIVKLKDVSIDMKTFRNGKSAEDVVAIINNRSNNRLGIITAKELSLENDMLFGKKVTFISSVNSKKEDDFDHLIIENQSTMSTKASNLSYFVAADSSRSLDYYSLREILAKEATRDTFSWSSTASTMQEICRRISLALAALSFTLIGTAFGMDIGRTHSKKGIFWSVALSAFFMICFIAAKSFRHSPWIAIAVYLFPHLIILWFSFRALKKVSAGVE